MNAGTYRDSSVLCVDSVTFRGDFGSLTIRTFLSGQVDYGDRV
jgi:hypothetical protein